MSTRRLRTERARGIVRLGAASDRRTCGRCRVIKSADEFGIRCRETGARQVWCRGCMAEYKREWYMANRAHHLVRVGLNRDRTRRENQARAWEYLGLHSCVDCGETDPVVLQFDHLGDKFKDVSTMILSGFAWATIQAEIEKCQVRCVNCHRRKTAREQGTYERKQAFRRLDEPSAPYEWLIIAARAVSSVDRASGF